MEVSVQMGHAPSWAHSLPRQDRIALVSLRRARHEERQEADAKAAAAKARSEAIEDSQALARLGVNIPPTHSLLTRGILRTS